MPAEPNDPSLKEQMALAVLSVREAGRSLVSRDRALDPYSWRFNASSITQMLLVPQDLRTADPSFVTEISDGDFGLAGASVETEGRSPFDLMPATAAWERELHGFGWLRHFRVSADTEAAAKARVLVRDWTRRKAKVSAVAFEPAVTARRVISWLSHSAYLLEDSDDAFFDGFLSNLGRQIRYLEAVHGTAAEGIQRLTALQALTLAGLCASGQDGLVASHAKAFADELNRQILPDGGHITRNPLALVEFLLDALPLRQCFLARSQTPPRALTDAIDRALPMVRFMRLGDGTFARFNGVGPSPADEIAIVLAYDDGGAFRLRHAPHSGYARLHAGPTIILADCGSAPPLMLSGDAHAGCLSFEMSVGPQSLIVNCGAPALPSADWRVASRATAAHSSVTLNEQSSARLVVREFVERALATPGLRGPQGVSVQASPTTDLQEFAGFHIGFEDAFGIVHQRRLRLYPDGQRLDGLDRLVRSRAMKQPDREPPEFAVRFHLHPAVMVQAASEIGGAQLELPGGQLWTFAAKGGVLSIEESAFFASVTGPQKSLALVMRGVCDAQTEIRWIFAAQPAA